MRENFSFMPLEELPVAAAINFVTAIPKLAAKATYMNNPDPIRNIFGIIYSILVPWNFFRGGNEY